MKVRSFVRRICENCRIIRRKGVMLLVAGAVGISFAGPSWSDVRAAIAAREAAWVPASTGETAWSGTILAEATSEGRVERAVSADDPFDTFVYSLGFSEVLKFYAKDSGFLFFIH